MDLEVLVIIVVIAFSLLSGLGMIFTVLRIRRRRVKKAEINEAVEELNRRVDALESHDSKQNS